MRAIKSASSSSATGIRVWKSPIPYLFGGLALMLLLISVALVILVCSYRKHASQSSNSSGEEMKQAMSKNVLETHSEPEILVIMAGDDQPTFLAKPISSSTSYYCTCGAEPTTPSSISASEQRFTN